MAIRDDVTAEFVRQVFDYNADLGCLIWKYRPDRSARWNGRYAGKPAGTVSFHKRHIVKVNKKSYHTPRIIWLWMTGKWPCHEVDHIDCNPLNNRWDNLRDATRNQNQHNSQIYKTNTSGFKGVYFDKQSGKWKAQISLHGKRHNLGRYQTPEDAYAAYCRAGQTMHGQFFRSG